MATQKPASAGELVLGLFSTEELRGELERRERDEHEGITPTREHLFTFLMEVPVDPEYLDLDDVRDQIGTGGPTSTPTNRSTRASPVPGDANGEYLCVCPQQSIPSFAVSVG